MLILREVLRWKATEVAALLETSVPSVNSALQRARATLADIDLDETPATPMDDEQRALLDRYVDAFERYDLDRLTSLLHEDASWSMPPYDLWLQTHDDIKAWCIGPGAACEGSRLVPTNANGRPAFGQYKPSGPGGSFEPWSLQVVEIRDGRISDICFFLDTEALFPEFGLPSTPDLIWATDAVEDTGVSAPARPGGRRAGAGPRARAPHRGGGTDVRGGGRPARSSRARRPCPPRPR